MTSQPDIALIWLTVKEGTEGFLEKTAPNVNASQKETENVRFDLFEPLTEAPGTKTWTLFEVYPSSAAAAAHKENEHFATWKSWIVDQLAENGRDRRQYTVHGNDGNVEVFRGGDIAPGMDVTCVHVSCKAGTEAAFVEATLKNKAGVHAEEPGAVRFDILQQVEDPTKFVLFEVFKDADAVATHKTMPYFLKWREEVQEMMADPRRGEKVKIVPTAGVDAKM